MKKKILLIRLGGLGDLLVALPSVCFVRKKLSPCSLTLVCRREYGLIFKETGLVDNILSSSELNLAPLFTDYPLTDESSTRWLRTFWVILGWMQKERSLALDLYCRASGKTKCHFIVFDPKCPDPIHKFFFQRTADFFDDRECSFPSFRECSILPLSSNQKVNGLKPIRQKKMKKGEKIVVVHPGSGSAGKRWPIENFLKIIHLFPHAGIRGVLVTGMADEDLEKVMKSKSLPPNWTWIKNPPLLELAGLLSNASFYLGNDSGITHLAAMCGIKGMALFRKDLETAWRPVSNISVLSGKTLTEIPVEFVWNAIKRTSFFQGNVKC